MVRLGLQLGILDALKPKNYQPKKKVVRSQRRITRAEIESSAVSKKMLGEHRRAMKAMNEDIRAVNEKVSIFDTIIEQNGHKIRGDSKSGIVLGACEEKEDKEVNIYIVP